MQIVSFGGIEFVRGFGGGLAISSKLTFLPYGTVTADTAQFLAFESRMISHSSASFYRWRVKAGLPSVNSLCISVVSFVPTRPYANSSPENQGRTQNWVREE
jgi:hypothetical protein